MKKICSTIFAIFIYTSLIFSQDPKEIVKMANDKLRGESLLSTMTMTIVRPQWSRKLSMKTWEKGDRYSLILITAPAKDNGTSFLKRGNDLWQWLPSIQRTIKIPGSMMNQSWMGSDFTNDDLVREASVVDDYNHRLISDTLIDGKPAYQIEMIPKPQAPVVWEKVIVYVTKEEYNFRKELFYGENGKLVNIMKLNNVKKMDGRDIPTNWEMIPVDKKDQKTVIELQTIKYNVQINEEFFSLQNLRRIR
ncbi:MAG TPA: outer membrane lipoprotein-sorting protein [Chitinispirillaceae bacterium]|nr:outer membrane lipoprotein-sorting protein [Chitinispirillaceae bacterium]